MEVLMVRHSLAVAVGVVAALVVSGPVHGAPLEKGSCELSPAVSFAHSSFSASGAGSADLTTFTANGLVGYCVSSRVELLGTVLLNHVSFEGESDTSGGLTFGVGFNFPSGGRTVPYIRAEAGFLTNVGGGETTTIIPALEGGLRVMVGSASSVNFGVGYTHQSNALGVQDVSGNIIAFTLGVSIFPGS
jgi:hypothetical protein